MASNELFGWDLLYKTVESEIKSESDLIIALIHWFLAKSSSFRCLGVGDDKTLSSEEIGSELLPTGWNENQDAYSLRYVFNKKIFNLLAAKTEGILVVNLLNVETKNASNFSVTPTETVKSIKGGLKTMIPKVTEVLDRVKRELVDPVFDGKTAEVTTQTRDTSSSDRTHFDDPLIIPSNNRRFQQFPPVVNDPLRDIGRGDLDPLGRGGGGMIFPPPPGSPFGNNPAGSMPGIGGRFPPPPPGARFDPFGPPDATGGRINPNPNHFRPPPDFDDMYM